MCAVITDSPLDLVSRWLACTKLRVAQDAVVASHTCTETKHQFQFGGALWHQRLQAEDDEQAAWDLFKEVANAVSKLRVAGIREDNYGVANTAGTEWSG